MVFGFCGYFFLRTTTAKIIAIRITIVATIMYVLVESEVDDVVVVPAAAAAVTTTAVSAYEPP